MIEANWQNFCGFSCVWKNYNHLKYILAENCQAKGVNYVTSARGFLVSCCGSSHINIKLPNLLSHLQSPCTKVLLWSLYRKQTLRFVHLACWFGNPVRRFKRSIFTMSKMDRQLSRQKFHQRISVMQTYSLHVSRELAFQFMFCLEDNNTSVCFQILRFFDELFRIIIDNLFLTF